MISAVIDTNVLVKVFYSSALAEDGAKVVTGNLKHFPQNADCRFPDRILHHSRDIGDKPPQRIAACAVPMRTFLSQLP